MAGVNKVILVGNLGDDPEVRALESGIKVARIRVATSETYTNKENQRVEQTEWHNVVLWRGLADVAEKYLSQGKQVYIEGRIRTRKWTDKENIERYSTEIQCDQMQMLGHKSDYNQNENQQSSDRKPSESPRSAVANEDTEDDLPF